MRRKKIVSHVLQLGCRDAVDPTTNPIMIGDETVNNSILRAKHFNRDINNATRAWTILVKAVKYAPLVNKMFEAGSPSVAWTAIENRNAPKGAVQRKQCGLKKSRE